MKRQILIALMLPFLGTLTLVAADGRADPVAKNDADTPPKALEPIEVEAQPWMYNYKTRYAHSLPEVDGATITVTKKTSVVKLDQLPTVINNNQRELFSRLPGIVIAEQQDPTQLNLTYRGIGNPQESEYILSLQDGIPTALDWIAYPTQYYLPIPQTIDSIQMIRGGSGLLYGPQPQPVINYVSREPDPDHLLTGTAEQVFGSHGLFSSYNELTGTRDALGYLADFSHRESDGPRSNGDFNLNAGDLRLSYSADKRQQWKFDFHGYSLESGLPGFLTLQQFENDPDTTTTPNDRLWTSRHTGTLRYDMHYSEQGLVTLKLWAGKTEVAHRSDSYSAGTATSASISDQKFHFTGLDARLAQGWGSGNALTIGLTAYKSRSSWTVFDDLQPNAGKGDHSGALSYDNSSTTKYGALFAESVFRFGNFHIVPSARFEREVIRTYEKFAASPPHTGPLVHDTISKNVPLFGLGFGNDFGHGNETYFNIAQGYRPVRYRDLASNRSRLNSDNDPDPTKYLTLEMGVHGWPMVGLFYDVSVFEVRTKNRIEGQSDGRGGSINVNSGDARSRGLELELDYDILRLWPSTNAGRHLDLFLNASLLHSRITDSITLENNGDPDGPTLDGNTPSYAPDYVIKAGLTWREEGLANVSLVAQTTASQFWADSNLPRISGGVIVMPARIPDYTVLDLSADFHAGANLRLLGGISNLTDHRYFSRVFFVNGGIEPAAGRSFYLGAAYDFD